jgi:hypothetical protein
MRLTMTLLDLDPVHHHTLGAPVEFKCQTHRQWSDATQCQGGCFLDHRREHFYLSFLFIPDASVFLCAMSKGNGDRCGNPTGGAARQ